MVAASSVCPACQAVCRPGQTTCSNCGLIFASRPMGGALAAPSVCRSCGRAVRAEARVCGGCGTPLTLTFAPLQPGQSLARGRYTVERVLSKGGMGTIYLATDHDAFNRTVVVKALLDYFDPTRPRQMQAARERLKSEAQTLSTLRHSAIPQIFTYFEDGAQSYIVMEYIEGPDLLQGLTHNNNTTGVLVVGRAYAQHEVLRWGAALCRVLEYLHSRQPYPVVHHDIKPANLILDRNSHEVRLVDFGTASSLLIEADAAEAPPQQTSVFGTPGYAPPEQYRGKSETRSDVYALAATLYHLVTDDDPGAHPFDFPRLDSLGPIGQALRGALQREVVARPTASILRRHLEGLLVPSQLRALRSPDGEDLPDAVALVRWCEKNWYGAGSWLSGGLPEQIERIWGNRALAQELRDRLDQQRSDSAAALDEVLALLDPQGFGAQPPRLVADRPALDFGTLAANASSDTMLVITNSGRRYVRAQIHLPEWATSEQLSLALIPGQQLAVTLHADLRRARASRRLRDRLEIRAGSTVLLTMQTQATMAAWRVLLRRLFQPLLLTMIVLAMLSTVGNWSLANVREQPPITVDLPRPIPSPRTNASAVPQLGAVAGADAPQQAAPLHPPFKILRTVQHDNEPILRMAFTPDRQTLAALSAGGDLTLWYVSDGSWQRTFHTIGSFTFSPDGQLVATSSPAESDHTIKIWRLQDGKLIQHVAGHDRAAKALAFSSDSSSIAASDGTTINLWRVEDGTLLRIINTPGDQITALAFSPDGQLLAEGDQQGKVMLWSLDDGDLVRSFYGHAGDQNSLASPIHTIIFDEKLLALGGESRVTVRTIKGDLVWQSIKSSSGPAIITFSPARRSLAWVTEQHVALLRQSDGAVTQPLDGPQTAVQSAAISPDGHLIATGDQQGLITFWRAQP